MKVLLLLVIRYSGEDRLLLLRRHAVALAGLHQGAGGGRGSGCVCVHTPHDRQRDV